MKKPLILIISIVFLSIFLISCSSQSSMLRKMNIKDLPEISDVEYIGASSNLVSRSMIYAGEQEDFNAYVLAVYDYLNDNFYDTLGYKKGIMQSFFGTNETYYFYNQTSSIEQFKNESEEKISFEFIFSSSNTFWEPNSNEIYLEDACSIFIIYFKESQEIENVSESFNIIVEYYKPLNHNTYIHVNSDIFSSQIFKSNPSLTTKEYMINLFLEQYDLSMLSKEEVVDLLGVEQYLYNELQYAFGDSDGDSSADKSLNIYYNGNLYVSHEVIDIND